MNLRDYIAGRLKADAVDCEARIRLSRFPDIRDRLRLDAAILRSLAADISRRHDENVCAFLERQLAQAHQAKERQRVLLLPLCLKHAITKIEWWEHGKQSGDFEPRFIR